MKKLRVKDQSAAIRAFIDDRLTDTSPWSLHVGLTVISTSCPRAVRKSRRRSTEKVPERLRIKAEK